MRKYVDVSRNAEETMFSWSIKRVSITSRLREGWISIFGQLILDCLNRTENAMTQDHAFKAAELCLKAQAQAAVLY